MRREIPNCKTEVSMTSMISKMESINKNKITATVQVKKTVIVSS